MFENLTERLSRTVQQLRGKGRLTEDAIRATLREVRIALLEADVALPVVQGFIASVQEKALGQEIVRSLTPGQAMVKLVHDELVQLMGAQNEALDLRAIALLERTDPLETRALAFALGGLADCRVRQERYAEAERDISTGEELNPNARTLKTLRAMYRDAVDPVSPSIIIDDRRDGE